MEAFLAIDEQPTAEWLTGVLRHKGWLAQGSVVGLEAQTSEAHNASLTKLSLSYAPDVMRDLPRRLLLKRNVHHAGQAEVALYRLVAALDAPLPMLVPCYAAAYDQRSGSSYCLLADLSQTHAAPVTRQQAVTSRAVPPDNQLEQIVETLARFHAYWWEHPCLGSGVGAVRGWYASQIAYQNHIQRRVTEFAAFLDAVGDWFPADLRALYEDTLWHLPRLWERCLEPRIAQLAQLTLTHGDCYLSQFLCPRQPGSGATYLADFQDVSANLCAYDLVHLCATFWTSAQRQEQRREERLLRRYLLTLRAHGVRGYSWEQLLDDYRLMVTLMIFDPIWNQTSGSPPSYWWTKLRCLVGAFRDLRCAELLRA